MDSRKILEIYKRINDRRLKPASAWPSVADIPQGALVLDSDGVVKLRTTVFNNAGIDEIRCGRPSDIISLLSPDTASTVCVVVQPASTGGGFLFSVGDSTTLQTSLSVLSEGVAGGVGANGVYCSPAIAKTTDMDVYTLFTDGETFAKVRRGQSVSTVSRGSATSPGPLLIGARYGFTSNNFEGLIVSISFFAGFNTDGTCNGLTLVDKYDFTKWDGSANGASLKGNPYTIVARSPITERVAALVPVSML